MSIYDEQTNDYRFNIGDTCAIQMEFRNEDGSDIDVTDYECKFYLYDPITKDAIPLLSGATDYTKKHDDLTSGGGGVYYFGDTEFPGLVSQLESSNQIIILLSSLDTHNLKPGVYFYAVKFKVGATDYWVPVTGHIIFNRGSFGV